MTVSDALGQLPALLLYELESARRVAYDRELLQGILGDHCKRPERVPHRRRIFVQMQHGRGNCVQTEVLVGTRQLDGERGKSRRKPRRCSLCGRSIDRSSFVQSRRNCVLRHSWLELPLTEIDEDCAKWHRKFRSLFNPNRCQQAVCPTHRIWREPASPKIKSCIDLLESKATPYT